MFKLYFTVDGMRRRGRDGDGQIQGDGGAGEQVSDHAGDPDRGARQTVRFEVINWPMRGTKAD